MFQPGPVGGSVGAALPVGAEELGGEEFGGVELGAVVPAGVRVGVEDEVLLFRVDGEGPGAGSEAAGAHAPSRTARTPPKDRTDVRLLLMGTSRTASDRSIVRRSVHCEARRCIRGRGRRNRS
ncbi:hypothetical protein D6T65_14295 [Arthrobacter frigidicola]|nr:hypothetical protein D6T65_14295 [Arthrobacter frigidicola]